MASGEVNEAYEFGKFAEIKASEEYVKKGFAILERRWRHGKNEVDLIVQKGNIVAFVEVKARSGRHMMPLEAITSDKKRRMVKSADSYLRKLQGDYDYRFDFVAVTGTTENFSIEILEDAFLAADIF